MTTLSEKNFILDFINSFSEKRINEIDTELQEYLKEAALARKAALAEDEKDFIKVDDNYITIHHEGMCREFNPMDIACAYLHNIINFPFEFSRHCNDGDLSGGVQYEMSTPWYWKEVDKDYNIKDILRNMLNTVKDTIEDEWDEWSLEDEETIEPEWYNKNIEPEWYNKNIEPEWYNENIEPEWYNENI